MNKLRTHMRSALRVVREFGATIALGVGFGAIGMMIYAGASRPIASSASASPERVAAALEQPSRPFPNCAAARAAGADPVYRGAPGYGPHLDRDGDGVGCEPYPRN